MNIQELITANRNRAKRWHAPDGLLGWTALEWAGAMAGEAGEACNAAKKLRRVEQKLANINVSNRSLPTEIVAKEAVGKECADTILYALLLMERVGVDAEETIRKVFNEKSEEYGFPERL